MKNTFIKATITGFNEVLILDAFSIFRDNISYWPPWLTFHFSLYIFNDFLANFNSFWNDLFPKVPDWAIYHLGDRQEQDGHVL